MRVLIEASPIGPLSILPELPDARLAMLEGFNGIGKTLAVRLLQICTGDQPYRPDTAPWESLCEGLGKFTVTVSGLNGAREIQWVADSREWDAGSDDGIAPPHFQKITIDGRAASLDEVRSLLTVLRLGGEQGIVETLARLADRTAETVRRWARRYADQEAGPLASMEEAAATSVRLLGGWSSEAFLDLTKSVEKAREQVRAAEKETEKARQRRDDLSGALELSRRLQEIRRRAPELADRLRTIDAGIGDIQRNRVRLQNRVRAIAGQVAAAQPQRTELQNARRTLERRRKQLSSRLEEAAILGSELEIQPDDGSTRSLMTDLEAEIAELEAERIRLDAAPSMRILLDQLTPQLADAERQGLGGQLAVDHPELEWELTVSQTRVGMQTRRAFLEGQPAPPQAQEVVERLERTHDSLNRAASLRSALREAERLRRLVAQNEERVNNALAAINPKAVDEMQRLEEERRSADERLLELAAVRAALAQQLGPLVDETTATALTHQLRASLQQLGVSEDDLEPALAEAESTLASSRVAQQKAQNAEVETARQMAQAGAEVRKARTALTESPKLEWIRAAIPSLSSLTRSSTLKDQLAGIDMARECVESAGERLGELRSQLGAVESALRGVGRHLRGLDPEAVRYLPELESWFSERFSEWFNTERIRKELLPGAAGDVKVDVKTRDVIWTEGGSIQRRPLEAFSSGEQAFAYTRARLGELDVEDVKPANRLIVLDEFGAFIAHDRLTGLLAYLRDRATIHPQDQVLVMLPLSRDYAELARTSIGLEAEKFERFAEEITFRKYVVRVLVQ